METGSRISHFEIVQKLGEGGMGAVYKARDLLLDRMVAIKVLTAKTVSSHELQMRFIQEAKAASALNHPHIVTVYEIDTGGETAFIAMEYVEGRTLEQLISRKPLPLTDALRWAVQVADALAAAQSAGIVHRDLKPSNVMITGDTSARPGESKLLDFGLATLTQADRRGEEVATRSMLTVEGSILGTICYMSPEQAEGKPADARSDIFSFGCMLYEMITGRRAFTGESTASILAAILRDQPRAAHEIAPGIPRPLERVITRCLEKDPRRRYYHAADLRTALEDVAGEPETTADAPAAAPARRWRTGLAVAAAFALGAVLMLLALRPWTAKTPHHWMFTPQTYSGTALFPAISPDGRQLAFIWNGEKQDQTDLYVKLVDGGTPLRLTNDIAVKSFPAWSPDGNRIAFLRGDGVYVISALGGPVRKVSALPTPGYGLTWSPDGKWLALPCGDVYPPRLCLMASEGGEKREITVPPARSMGDDLPAFSPDGRTLAFRRRTNLFINAVYALALKSDGTPAGEAKALTSDEHAIGGMDWLPGGRELLVSVTFGSSGSELARLPASGGVPERLNAQGYLADQPSVSRHSGRIAYRNSTADQTIFRLELGRTPGAGSPQPIVASRRNNSDLSISADGSRIAFESSRTGNTEIWIANADGTGQLQVTSFNGRTRAGSPRWAPDGTQLAFDGYSQGSSDIYTVNVEGGQPRQLMRTPYSEIRPSWSRDGRWIYYGSDQTGRYEIWKTPAGGGAAVQVTRNGGEEGFETADGGALIFWKRSQAGLWRLDLASGEERRMLQGPLRSQVTVGNRSAYVLGPGEHPKLMRMNVTTGEMQAAYQFPPGLEVNFSGGPPIAVAPDESFLIYKGTAYTTSEIMLIDGFR